MSYHGNKNALRLTQGYNWPNRFIERIDSQKSLYNFSLYRHIEKYLTSVFYNFENKIEIGNTNILVGSFSITSYFGGIIVYINFFFDLKITTKNQIDELKKGLKHAKIYLMKVLKLKITFILNNFYMFMWKYELYNDCVDIGSLRAIQTAQKTNPYYIVETEYFRTIRGSFEEIKRQFNFYAKNQFFYRVIQPLFILFHHKHLDCRIIANIIAHELGLLRKGHKYFLLFIKNILSFFFNRYNKKIKGIKIIIKGRLTLQNRQTRRKQKKIILFGTMHDSKRNVYIAESSSLAHNRFGIINVNLSYSYHKRVDLTDLKKKTKNNNIATVFYKGVFIKRHKPMLTAILKDQKIFMSFFFLFPFLKNRLTLNISIKKFIMESIIIKSKEKEKYAYISDFKLLKSFLRNFK